MSQIPLLERLKKRKLVQWGVAYLAGAWVLLQVLDQLSDTYAWPPVILRVITAVVGVGFFGALVLAWYHGEQGRQRVSGPELLMLAGILVVAGAAVTLVGWEKQAGPSTSVATAGSAPAPAPVDRSIAVLPFGNLSADPDNEYFSDGITEAILTSLAKISDLKVISRTSVMQYKETRKPLRQIGQELGVAHVLEGSVQRAGDRVRITAQLINARTDEHLWAENYDRELKDIFAVQTEIAQKIVGALEVRLTEGERAPLARHSTENPAAYELYLKGRYVWDLGGTQNSKKSMEYFRKALEIDSTYALAYAGLADAYSELGLPPKEIPAPKPRRFGRWS